MFKVTICDFGKMDINMTDKIEKKEATFAVPYNGEDNNDYADGKVVQHIEYVPFGEVFVEERNNIWNTPYLFNAKEFDEETGLYYYGARYYDPRVSLWISVDPLSIFNPHNEENYIEGEHNGGVFNNNNLNSYSYCYQNPIILTDPNGEQVFFNDYINKFTSVPLKRDDY